MEPTEKSNKKRIHPWIQAAMHFSLCFAIGALVALTPLAATGAPSATNIRASFLGPFHNTHRAAAPPLVPDLGLLLIVTATRPDGGGGMAQEASLARLAHTLRHVAPPLLWIVVGAGNTTETARAVRVLRGTGVMFRHLTYDASNFTGDEVEHQWNVALSHIERHRLTGVVHFAGASGVYDLLFFQELRQTRGFAAWPVTTISPAEQIITVEGPACNLTQITSWYSKDSSTNGTSSTSVSAVDTSASNRNSSSEPPKTNMYGIGFRSSLLWDSGRSLIKTNSSEGTTQDFIQIVQLAIKDEIHENELKGSTPDCSESHIMLWHLDMPRFTLIPERQKTQQHQGVLARNKEKSTT